MHQKWVELIPGPRQDGTKNEGLGTCEDTIKHLFIERIWIVF